MIFSLLFMAGAVQALYLYRNLMKDAVKAPPAIFPLDARDGADTDPCARVSQAFEAAPKNATSKAPIILDLRPSVGATCIKTLPVTNERNLALLDYLRPYIECQTTIELLKNPPEEYLLPGVDILGGMDAIKEKLNNNGYESQFEVMKDLKSLIVASNDNHFDYTPGLLSAFRQVRQGFDFVSISTDGLEMPQVFAAKDVFTGEDTTYTASPIDTIDGQDVYEFLEKESMLTPKGEQDPDAKLNSLFRSIPKSAVGFDMVAQVSTFDIPDNYTIIHKNGTSRVVINSIITFPGADLSGIRSGQDFRQRFEIPPQNTSAPSAPSTPPTTSNPSNSRETETPTLPSSGPNISGYPLPLFKHSNNIVASYALNDTGLRNTMVISFLSFDALNIADPLAADFDLNSFVREFGDVVDRTAKVAKEQGRDKLIIDMSANGGGSVDLADFAYTTFFPGAAFDNFDRFRLSSGLEFTGRILNYDAFLGILVAPEGNPSGPDNKTIDTREAFFTASQVQGQNMMAAFHKDPSARIFIEPDVFLRGYGPNRTKSEANNAAPWKPEDIVILTDGLCASACTVFTGLMVRNFGIRTIALGGRPMNKPMQAMGGVKGSQVFGLGDIKSVLTEVIGEAQRSPDGRALLKDFGGSIPSLDVPPLLPLMEDRAKSGSVNFRNAHNQKDADGLPLHFKYEAANCRLFYTRNMAIDVTEAWRQAAKIAFQNGTCVSGSTVNSDGTIGTQTLPYDPSPAKRKEYRGLFERIQCKCLYAFLTE